MSQRERQSLLVHPHSQAGEEVTCGRDRGERWQLGTTNKAWNPWCMPARYWRSESDVKSQDAFEGNLFPEPEHVSQG